MEKVVPCVVDLENVADESRITFVWSFGYATYTDPNRTTAELMKGRGRSAARAMSLLLEDACALRTMLAPQPTAQSRSTHSAQPTCAIISQVLTPTRTHGTQTRVSDGSSRRRARGCTAALGTTTPACTSRRTSTRCCACCPARAAAFPLASRGPTATRPTCAVSQESPTRRRARSRRRAAASSSTRRGRARPPTRHARSRGRRTRTSARWRRCRS